MNKYSSFGASTTSVILILFLVGVFNSCGPTRSKSIREWEKHEWQIVKENKKPNPPWIISRRKIRNSPLWEYKIEGAIASTPNELVTRYRKELYDLAQGNNQKAYPLYKVIYDAKDSLLTYAIHNEPFPFRNTEMCLRYVFSTQRDGSMTIAWKESWGDCGSLPKRKLKRVESFRGGIRLIAEGDNETKCIQKVQFDPKGMPPWIFNPMVIKLLKKEFEKLRNTSLPKKEDVF